MKTLLFQLLLAFVVMLLMDSCKTEVVKPIEFHPTITLLTDHPPCNSLKSAIILDVNLNSQSCLLYSYGPSLNKLIITHQNAGFNCCPEGLGCTIAIKNDTIIITEFEISSGCRCNCLYDLEMEVKDLIPGQYQLIVIEPYVGDQAQISVALNFHKEQQGTFCVTRTQYPWGE